jgi:hypothetical protein
MPLIYIELNPKPSTLNYMAHLGVLEAMEEVGLPVDFICVANVLLMCC